MMYVVAGVAVVLGFVAQIWAWYQCDASRDDDL